MFGDDNDPGIRPGPDSEEWGLPCEYSQRSNHLAWVGNKQCRLKQNQVQCTLDILHSFSPIYSLQGVVSS